MARNSGITVRDALARIVRDRAHMRGIRQEEEAILHTLQKCVDFLPEMSSQEMVANIAHVLIATVMLATPDTKTMENNILDAVRRTIADTLARREELRK